jgi:hypothetical protein
MIKYMQHDGGRAESKRTRQSNDCVVRAFAIATGMDYDTVYDELAGLGRCCGHGTYDTQWHQLAKQLGFVRKDCPSLQWSLGRFVHNLPGSRLLVQVPRHVFAILNGVIFDEVMTHPITIVQSCWTLDLTNEELAKLPRLLQYGRQYE